MYGSLRGGVTVALIAQTSLITVAYAEPVTLTLGLLLFEIEIGTGSGIDFLRFGSVRNGIFRDAVDSSSQATQHRGHSIQLRLTHQTFLFIQRFADDQDILDGTTFQY